jgi:ribosomal protein S12 methylthiotransferase
MKSPRVGFVSLGCPKALVDSERILTQLRAEGYVISDNYSDASIVVVNTCGFIQAAVEESLEAITEALDENGRVIVTGCLGTRHQEILRRFPDLVAVTGPDSAESVMEAVRAELPPGHAPFHDLLPPGGIKLTPRHYAYLKIAEGCNNSCTFCVIPGMRGRLVSRSIHDIIDEASALVDAGVKELLVVSQDTAAYGADVKYRTELTRGRPLRSHITDLTRALGELGIWVRLHYVYPYPHIDELIPLMSEGFVVPYLDVPFQHCVPRILKRMKRPANAENNLARIRMWRRICPELTIRSTFIVGFPGETEDEFNLLLDFLTEAQLDRVGCFAYSPIQGATANDLDNPVAEEVREERLARFMAVQEEVSAERLRRRIGQTCTVLVDAHSESGVLARSTGESPEIDGVVIVHDGVDIEPGQFVDVRITGSDNHDLHAQKV